MPDQPWWRCAKAPKSWFVSKIAWVGKWCGNGTTDWMAIIVNNHVTPDRWRGKLDFLSDRLLGQVYLKNLAKDFIVFYNTCTHSWSLQQYKTSYEELVRRLELDGYVFRDNDLFQVEADVLDVEAESGLLASLHNSLGLSDREQTFEFLELAETHYVAGRWADCISNCRKFLEAILQQVADKHACSVKGTTLSQRTLQRPVEVRQYLEAEGLVERKEREAIDKIYGQLSHTGGHPYMAEKDQARLLRQISLTMTQFIMLRLEGALKAP